MMTAPGPGLMGIFCRREKPERPFGLSPKDRCSKPKWLRTLRKRRSLRCIHCDVIRIWREHMLRLRKPIKKPSGVNEFVKKHLVLEHAGLKRPKISRYGRVSAGDRVSPLFGLPTARSGSWHYTTVVRLLTRLGLLTSGEGAAADARAKALASTIRSLQAGGLSNQTPAAPKQPRLCSVR